MISFLKTFFILFEPCYNHLARAWQQHNFIKYRVSLIIKYVSPVYLGLNKVALIKVRQFLHKHINHTVSSSSQSCF